MKMGPSGGEFILERGVAPQTLKDEVVLSLKKPLLDLTILDNFHPVPNVSFLGEVIEKVVMLQV